MPRSKAASSSGDAAASGSARDHPAPLQRLSRRSAKAPGTEGWRSLPFFSEGASEEVAARVDARAAAGAQVLPPSPDIFTSLRLTPLSASGS